MAPWKRGGWERRERERSKVASKQTNRNAGGLPTVINDHPVVILSPIKGATPRDVSRYFDAVENRGCGGGVGGVACAVGL